MKGLTVAALLLASVGILKVATTDVAIDASFEFGMGLLSKAESVECRLPSQRPVDGNKHPAMYGPHDPHPHELPPNRNPPIWPNPGRDGAKTGRIISTQLGPNGDSWADFG